MGQFILKNIEMTLDPSSIEKAIRQVKEFERKLKPAMQCLIDYLGEKGVEVARAELIFFDSPAYRTGALSESVAYKSKNGSGVLSAGEGLEDGYNPPQSYAMYVEYGTGIYGEDVNGHGEKGWWYLDEKGRSRWTNGMMPRPFMANTLQDLEQEAMAMGGTIIAEYIRGERA